jgi:hypothetical protein
LGQRNFSRSFASHPLVLGFGIRAMSGKGRLIPWIAATGAIRNVLSSVKQGLGKTVVGTSLKVHHCPHIIAGVLVHEQPGVGRTSPLALLSIAGELCAPRREADGKIESVAEPHAHRLIRRIGDLGAHQRSGHPALARTFKDQVKPFGAYLHSTGGYYLSNIFSVLAKLRGGLGVIARRER